MVIGGKERTVLFTVNALIELRDKHGVDILKGIDEQSMSPETIRAIAFVGMKHGAKRDKVEFTETLDEVGDMLTIQVIGEIVKTLSNHSAKDGGEPGE